MEGKTMSDNEIQELNVKHSTSTAHRLANYDGACNNVHGHNLDWDVTLYLDYEPNNEDNMSVDFKKVSDTLDEVDHAILLNKDDDLVTATQNLDDLVGNFILFNGDPTCEVVGEWMAEKLFDLSGIVKKAEVSVAETDKYTFTTEYPVE